MAMSATPPTHRSRFDGPISVVLRARRGGRAGRPGPSPGWPGRGSPSSPGRRGSRWPGACRPDSRPRRRVRGDDLIGDGPEGAFVRDLPEAAPLDDRGDRGPVREMLAEDLLRVGPRQRRRPRRVEAGRRARPRARPTRPSRSDGDLVGRPTVVAGDEVGDVLGGEVRAGRQRSPRTPSSSSGRRRGPRHRRRTGRASSR